MAKEVVVRHFAKDAFNAGMDIELIGETAEAAAKMAFLVHGVATGDQLRSPPDELP